MLEYPLQIYVDDDMRENYLKSHGKMVLYIKKDKSDELKMDAQEIIDLQL